MKILVSGAKSKLGQYICEAIQQSDSCELFAVMDLAGIEQKDVRVINDIQEILHEDEKPDVIIDVDGKVSTDKIIRYAYQRLVPFLIGTEDLEPPTINTIAAYTKYIPISFITKKDFMQDDYSAAEYCEDYLKVAAGLCKTKKPGTYRWQEIKELVY